MFIFLFIMRVLAQEEQEIVPQHWVFEYVNAFFEGLDAEFYVKGTAVCASNFKRTEEYLFYMNNYLAEHKGSSQEEVEGIIFNVTTTMTTFMPFTIYFCYSLPEKTELLWI